MEEGEKRRESRGRLLEELERFRDDEVQEVVGRISAAIGEINAADIDVERHVLEVARDALRGREGQRLSAELGPRLAGAEEALWLVAEDGTIIAASERAAAAFGYTPEELAGRSNEMIRPEGHDWRPQARQLEAKGEHADVGLVRHRDGSTLSVAWRGRVLRIAGRTYYFARLKVMASTASAAGPMTYDDLKTGGWTYEQLRRFEWKVGAAAGLVTCLCELQGALHGYLGIAAG